MYGNEISVMKILKRAPPSVTVLCNEEKLLQCWVLVRNYPGARHLQSCFVPSRYGVFGSLRGLSPGHFLSKKKKTLMPWWGSGGVEGGWEQEMTEAQEFILRARLKKGKGRGRGRKLGKGKGTLSPQFLASLPQATRVYNLIYGRPGTILPSIRPENRLFFKSYALESFIEQMSPEFGKK